MRVVETLIGPSLVDQGYDVVRVKMIKSARPTLQVMAERSDGQAMTVEDCATISRCISVLLDVDNPIPGEYVLEVSSPGLDRPLVRANDFVKFVGSQVKIELDLPVEGKLKFKGTCCTRF